METQIPLLFPVKGHRCKRKSPDVKWVNTERPKKCYCSNRSHVCISIHFCGIFYPKDYVTQSFHGVQYKGPVIA